MRKPRLPCRYARFVLVIAGLMLVTPTLAGTWQWRDAAGRMVYSDQPPPPGVPASRIVQAPAQGIGSHAAPAPAAAPGTAGGSATAPRNWIEKEQASRKRALEREEAEGKERAEHEQTARTARACEDARTALRTLESGIRVSFVDDQGERRVIDDAERARRTATARQEIARNCTAAG